MTLRARGKSSSTATLQHENVPRFAPNVSMSYFDGDTQERTVDLFGRPGLTHWVVPSFEILSSSARTWPT